MTHEDYIYRVYGSDMYKYIEQVTDTQSTDIGKALENAIEQGQTKDRQQDKGHEEYKDYEDTITKVLMIIVLQNLPYHSQKLILM